MRKHYLATESKVAFTSFVGGASGSWRGLPLGMTVGDFQATKGFASN